LAAKPAKKPSAKAAPAAAPLDSQATAVPSQTLTLNNTSSNGERADAASAQRGQLELEKTLVPVPASQPPAQQRVTSFRPFWLENELFLVREVAEAGGRHVQG